MLQTNGINRVCDWLNQIANPIGARAYIMRPSPRSKKMAQFVNENEQIQREQRFNDREYDFQNVHASKRIQPRRTGVD